MRLTVEKGESKGDCKVAGLVCMQANNQESLSVSNKLKREGQELRLALTSTCELFHALTYVTIKEFSIYFFKF